MLFSCVVATQANEPVRVGLIVIGPDGTSQTACISLDSDDPTGYDVLVVAELDINAAVGPLGVKICAINGTGCFAPAQECFCQCEGGQCSYWSYYYRTPEDEEWVYSSAGAGNRHVDEGYVEMWIWRPYDSDDPELPSLSWNDICGDDSAPQHINNEQSSNSDRMPLWGYIIFGIAALAVIAGVLWQRRH